MNKYESALKQVCLQCGTNKNNCRKDKCVRYNALKELVVESCMTINDRVVRLLVELDLESLKACRRTINSLINKKTLEERESE